MASPLYQSIELLSREKGIEPGIVVGAVEEAIAEKICAASQRSKIRDLYDLAEISRRPLRQELVRSLAVLKLWQGGGAGLDR